MNVKKKDFVQAEEELRIGYIKFVGADSHNKPEPKSKAEIISRTSNSLCYWLIKCHPRGSDKNVSGSLDLAKKFIAEKQFINTLNFSEEKMSINFKKAIYTKVRHTCRNYKDTVQYLSIENALKKVP